MKRAEKAHQPTYSRATPEELWRYRMEMHARGLGYVEYFHPRGKAFYFSPIKHLIQTGVDVFLGEECPRYAER